MKTKFTYQVFSLLLISYLLISNLNLYAQKDEVNPYQLKSAILVKICKVTTWEDEHLRNNKTFKIYTIGKSTDNKGIHIRKDVLINGRSIEIIHIESIVDLPSKLSAVDVIYIYSLPEDKLIEVLKLVENKNILTVSDNEGFGELGVVINFIIENDKVIFEINRYAELKSQITLKSFLYRLKGVRLIN